MPQDGPGLYAAAALKARETVAHDVTVSYEKCGHEENLLIVHFLQEIRDEWVRRGRDHVKTLCMGRAATSVRACQQRIYNANILESLPKIGPEIRRMVVEHLWTLSGCAPADPTPEELRLEEQKQAAAAADKKRKAAAAKVAKQALQAQQEQIAHNPQQAIPAPAASPEQTRPKKKARKQKEYIPGVGTAAYAFLITLFQAHKHGEEHLSRTELSDRAEASGLSDKPIFGNGQANNVNNPQRWYNGWSTFSTLKNREPPLVVGYSNPLKCKLTAEGTAMAARLYRDAVSRNRIPEDPAIPLASLPDPTLLAPPSAAAGSGSGAGPSAGPTGGAASGSAAAQHANRAASGASAQQPLPQQARRASGGASTSKGSCSAAAAVGQAAAPSRASHGRALVPSQSVASGVAMPNIPLGSAGLPNLTALPLRERLAAATRLVEASMAAQRNPQAAQAQGAPQAYFNPGGHAAAAPAQHRPVAGAFGGHVLMGGLAPAGPQMVTSVPVQPGRGTAAQAPTHTPAGRPGPSHQNAPVAEAEVVDLLSSDDEDMATPAPQQAAPIRQAAAAPQEIAGPSEPEPEAEPEADDNHVAQLVDMGFTPEQATTALKSGRSVEEAIEVLMVSSDEDEPDLPAPAQTATQAAQPFDWALADLPAALHAPDLRIGRSNNMPALQQSQQGSTVVMRGSQPQLGSEGMSDAHPGSQPARQPPFLDTQGSQADDAVLDQPGSAAQHQRAAQRQAQQRAQTNMIAQAAEARAAALPRLPPAAPAAQLPLPGQRTASQPGLQRNDSAAGSGLSRATSEHTGQVVRGVWRLQGLGGEWGLGDREVRLPPLPPGVAFRDVYEVVLVLDNREQFGNSVGGRGHASRTDSRSEGLRQLRNLGINVDMRHSDTGDALWVARSKARPGDVWALDYVVERKSVHDLVGSIKNHGRYEKQKYALRRCGLRRIMYLLEGNPDIEVQGAELKAVKTAMATTEVVDGFEVLHTANVADTFRLYATITKRLVAKYGPLTSTSQGVQRGGEALPTFEQLCQRVNANKKITVRDVWGLMLTALPGVGAELAEAILRVYPTPLLLRNAYEDAMKQAPPGAAVQRAQGLLAGLIVSPARKISMNQSAKVFDSLFAAGWHCV
ncbi:probable crossover junction endonuclease MUS81 [Coccomyxa sp. Obi]|nr:probable crossover junction endonuclease MUS81 [Coccomyxa sp. Obi]